MRIVNTKKFKEEIINNLIDTGYCSSVEIEDGFKFKSHDTENDDSYDLTRITKSGKSLFIGVDNNRTFIIMKPDSYPINTLTDTQSAKTWTFIPQKFKNKVSLQMSIGFTILNLLVD